MSNTVDNRLLRANQPKAGLTTNVAKKDSEQLAKQGSSINRSATTHYLNTLSSERDEVGDTLSRSMNRLNQSLGQAAAQSSEVVDEQAEKMAVYTKLAGKLINRDSNLQEKVAQDLSSGTNAVRSRDAAQSLEKAMQNMPSSLKEGTQAGKDLAKFMVENLVNLTDTKNMGAGLERDLAVRQVNVPKNQPNARVQQASAKVLSASIDYVKSNQPEAIAKQNAADAANSAKGNAQANATITNADRNVNINSGAASQEEQAKLNNATYTESLKQNRLAHNQGQIPATTEQGRPSDQISAEISKRIHSLISQAANSAKNGNLIKLSAQEAENFDRASAERAKNSAVDNFISKNNKSDGQSHVVSSNRPPVDNSNIRQMSLSELSARAANLQKQFREDRQRIVQEGKLPNPAQKPNIDFTKDRPAQAPDAQSAAQDRAAVLAKVSAQTKALNEAVARAQSSIASHLSDSKAGATASGNANNAASTNAVPQGERSAAAQAAAQMQSRLLERMQGQSSTQQAPSSSSQSQGSPEAKGPAPAPNQAPASSNTNVAQSSGSKVTEAQVQTAIKETLHSLNSFSTSSINFSFSAVQSNNYGALDVMPGMTIPVSHFGEVQDGRLQPNDKALEALKAQALAFEQANPQKQSEEPVKENVKLTTTELIANRHNAQEMAAPAAPNNAPAQAPSANAQAEGSVSNKAANLYSTILSDGKAAQSNTPSNQQASQQATSGNTTDAKEQANAPVKEAVTKDIASKDVATKDVASKEAAANQAQNAKNEGILSSLKQQAENTAGTKSPNSAANALNNDGKAPTSSGSFSTLINNIQDKLKGDVADEKPSAIVDHTKAPKAEEKAQVHSDRSNATDRAANQAFLEKRSEAIKAQKEAFTALEQEKAQTKEQNAKAQQIAHEAEKAEAQEEFVAAMAETAAKNAQQNAESSSVGAPTVAPSVAGSSTANPIASADKAAQESSGKIAQLYSEASKSINQDGKAADNKAVDPKAADAKTADAKAPPSAADSGKQGTTVGQTNVRPNASTIASNAATSQQQIAAKGEQIAQSQAANQSQSGAATSGAASTPAQSQGAISSINQAIAQAQQNAAAQQQAAQAQSGAAAPQTGATATVPGQSQGAINSINQAIAQAQQNAANQQQQAQQAQIQQQLQAQAAQQNLVNQQVAQQLAAKQTAAQLAAQAAMQATQQTLQQVTQNAAIAQANQLAASLATNGNAATNLLNAQSSRIPAMPLTPNGMFNLDEDSLQDEIIKNVMQTVPSDDLDDFNLKGASTLSGIAAEKGGDSKITSMPKDFEGADKPNLVMTKDPMVAGQITTGQSAPIPDETVVSEVVAPKEGGLFRRFAALFSRHSDEGSAANASKGIVDPSKAALNQPSSPEAVQKQQEQVLQQTLRVNSFETLVTKLQTAAGDQSLPPQIQEQAQKLMRALNNPVHDLQSVSSWLNFITGPMSPSSSQAVAMHQWAFMLLCIRFEQIGKNIDKFLKKHGGSEKLNALEGLIKENKALAEGLDEVTRTKSHDLLKETFTQVDRMQQQMQSLPQGQVLPRVIPLPPNYEGGKEGSFSAKKEKDEDGGTSWRLNFKFDLENMGALQIKVNLRFPEIQMSFVAERLETLQKVQALMPDLNERLREIGLNSKGSSARLGSISMDIESTQAEESESKEASSFKFDANAFNTQAQQLI